jgi:Proteasome subunit
VHYFTLHGSLRPFGASALIACYDEEAQTHQLYMIEPSGLSHVRSFVVYLRPDSLTYVCLYVCVCISAEILWNGGRKRSTGCEN